MQLMLLALLLDLLRWQRVALLPRLPQLQQLLPQQLEPQLMRLLRLQGRQQVI